MLLIKKLLAVIFGLEQIWIVLTSVVSEYSSTTTHEPKFLGTLKNVTQIQGKDASFTCMVENLGNHKIAWIKVDTKAILAIHDHVITNNARLSVTMNDQVTWTLQIKSTQRIDRGYYMCQINTNPVQKSMAYLEVVIPPDITSEETTGDLMVPEGGTAKLICRARGHPKPIITWRKEDGNHIIIKEGQGGKRKGIRVKTYEGEVLNLYKITRSEMGAYFCIASNGVPPSVSKRMTVQVHFHPQIHVPNQLIAAPKGDNALIECTAEASPKAINYWTRDTEFIFLVSFAEMIIANEKFNMTEEVLSQYGVRMRLLIQNLTSRDFSGYKCISQNSMGTSEGMIHIHEMKRKPESGGIERGGQSSSSFSDDFSEEPEDGGSDGRGRVWSSNSFNHNQQKSHSTRVPFVDDFQQQSFDPPTSSLNSGMKLTSPPFSTNFFPLLLLLASAWVFTFICHQRIFTNYIIIPYIF